MTKAFLYSLNVLFLLIMGKFFAAGISIEQYATERIDHHKPFKVTLTFKTNELNGFAKFQHTFPNGVLVDAIETQGATATYENGKFLLIWMNLPDTNQFEVTYRVSVEDESIEELDLGGRFTYMVENERMTYDTPIRKVAIGIDPNEEIIVPDPVVEIKRNFKEELDGTYSVSVTVNKQNVKGFAKVQEYIPANAVVTSLENQGAVFSVVDKKVKFVWLELPIAQSFSVEYQIDLSQSEAQTPEDIWGEFSFVHEGATQKIRIPSAKEEPVLANEESQENQENQENQESQENQVIVENEESQVGSETNPIANTPVTQENNESNEAAAEVAVPEIAREESEEISEVPTVDNTKQPETPTPTTKEETNEVLSASNETDPVIPAPQSGVFYRVQITAGHNQVDGKYFSDKHQFSAPFFVEDHEGWIKYTTGEYEAYEAARDERESLKETTSLPGPFVVAYNSGERITVQEALMVTGQKWLK